MRYTRRAAGSLAIAWLLLVACEGGPTGPSVWLDEAFVLEPGQTATLQGRSVRIRFVGVTGDSRCPIDAFCITGGDAVVEIAVRSGRASERRYDLHTGDLRPVRHGVLTIALLRLLPDPISSQTIPPEAYRATLQVTR